MTDQTNDRPINMESSDSQSPDVIAATQMVAAHRKSLQKEVSSYFPVLQDRSAHLENQFAADAEKIAKERERLLVPRPAHQNEVPKMTPTPPPSSPIKKRKRIVKKTVPLKKWRPSERSSDAEEEEEGRSA